MSRNYELLKRFERENGGTRSAFGSVPADSAAAAATMAPHSAHRPRVEPQILPEVKKLVEQVFIVPGKHAPNVIVFADMEKTTPGTGICARVADVLATQNKSVCVVDANFENPTLHGYFQVGKNVGFSDMLRGERSINDFREPLDASPLTVIPSGSDGVGLKDVLNSELLATSMLELRKRFHYVLVQSPALGATSHSTLLGQFSDGLILVLEAHSTRREAARKLMDELERAKVKVLGTVLNNRTFPIPNAIYSKL